MNPNKCTCLTFIFALFLCPDFYIGRSHKISKLTKSRIFYFITSAFIFFKKEKTSRKKGAAATSEVFGVAPPDGVPVELEDVLRGLLADCYTLLQLQEKKHMNELIRSKRPLVSIRPEAGHGQCWHNNLSNRCGNHTDLNLTMFHINVLTS